MENILEKTETFDTKIGKVTLLKNDECFISQYFACDLTNSTQLNDTTYFEVVMDES